MRRSAHISVRASYLVIEPIAGRLLKDVLWLGYHRGLYKIERLMKPQALRARAHALSHADKPDGPLRGSH